MNIPIKYQDMLDQIVPVVTCRRCKGTGWRGGVEGSEMCRCVRKQVDKVIKITQDEESKLPKVKIVFPNMSPIQLS